MPYRSTALQAKVSQQQIDRLQTELRHCKRDLLLAIAERDQYRGRLAAMESSKFWQIRTRWLQIRQKLGGKESLDWTPELPPIEQIEAEIAQEFPKIQRETPYDRWRIANTPRAADLERMVQMAEILPAKPTISVLMPVYNPPEAYLRSAIESVLAQAYSYWELCIADDASTDANVRSIIKEYAAIDSRIKIAFRPENGHISACSNSALELATGEYIALLDHDDLLSPDALFEIALLLNRHPEADMIYSDEDKIDEQGNFSTPYFKPDWSPDSFLSRMYTCHLGAYRRSIVQDIGGFRIGYEGSQDYDLVLRLTEKTQQVFHIPKILYHWRIHPQSTAQTAAAKPYAYDASDRALAEALERRGEPGKLLPIDRSPGNYIVRYDIKKQGLVSVIIPTKDKAALLDRCLTSIYEKTTYPNYEIILIDNNSVELETSELIQKWRTKFDRFQCRRLEIPFNYARINNLAVQQSSGEYLLFLNNDVEVITPDWMTAMVEQAQRRSIGAVGALLLYPDNTIQHAGVVLGICAYSGHSHKHFPAEASGYLNSIIGITNYSAVTGACLMCKRSDFEAIGGFDENLAVSFNDIDLCLKLMAQGLHHVYLPHVKLYHYESQSRGQDNTSEKRDRFLREANYMMQRWEKWMQRDPHYNPNLTIHRQDYSIREC
ncbi:glycosyltransferase [Microcoleus sp. FACHB-1515]|uniref:glycosyltransferase family 2 protein n=2 Tax=Cyanophyceae TaxID=3028117 RepID=UPI001F5589B6|nr:glycosyltransferase family 2 protein [Microcoleus sp. FACHB-1515]